MFHLSAQTLNDLAFRYAPRQPGITTRTFDSSAQIECSRVGRDTVEIKCRISRKLLNGNPLR